MSINTVNYPSPVTVNGYSCKNCTEVDLAKQHIDPAHPKDGPYGVNKTDPGVHSGLPSDAKAAAHKPAVTFSGALAGLANAAGLHAPTAPQASAQGSRLDVTA